MPTYKKTLEIPITVDRAGKLDINIGRRTSDGAVYVASVMESALDGCRDLRPGDLLAVAPQGSPPPGATGPKLYGVDQFKNYLSTGVRPLRFIAVRTVVPIQIDQPGPLGFEVEEYVPKDGDAEQVFTRVASVEDEQSSKVQENDFICYPGSRGSVNIPRNLFVNTLSSCRPLCFDVIRSGIGKKPRNKTSGAKEQTEGLFHPGTKNKNTDSTGRPSAKCPVGEDGRPTSSSAAAASTSSTTNATKKKQPVASSPTRSEDYVAVSTKSEKTSGSLAGTTKKSIEIIDLLDSDSDGEELTSSATNTTAGTTTGSSSFMTASSMSFASSGRKMAGPARTGAATHHQPGKMRFPSAIDTLFNGNDYRIPPLARGMNWSIAQPATLTEIRSILRSTNKIDDLKFIWPMDTPVSFGFR